SGALSQLGCELIQSTVSDPRPNADELPRKAPPVFEGRPVAASGCLALESFLQLARELVGCRIHRALHDLGRMSNCLVEALFEGRLPNDDQPGQIGREL